MQPAAANIDDYIAQFPMETQAILEQLRSTIRAVVPEAQEVISYGMPAFKLKSVLVYFAATKNHIGFYPTSSGVAAFQDELAPHDYSKGTIRFPMDKPLPLDLIRTIVRFRVEEARAKVNERNVKTLK